MSEHSDDVDKLLDRNKQENSPIPSWVQGLGMGLPDLRSKKKGKQTIAKESHASEALHKLREQKREAVKRLGGENLGNDAMMEDLVKQFEELVGSKVFYDSTFTIWGSSCFWLKVFNFFFFFCVSCVCMYLMNWNNEILICFFFLLEL
ncbi:hypothetical protein M9H77_32093 [Catharanthus roseus]|uniref:Uncharacterized protein n=1 Tax=Catharanthus roseus TaxID=4058 RepID=A0ACC0A2V7_CATRO|nr:hypothetical protein M9H77_32093 [Catharanthus roseus]